MLKMEPENVAALLFFDKILISSPLIKHTHTPAYEYGENDGKMDEDC